MSPEKRPRPKRSGIEVEEERTWVEFYKRVRKDTALAAEVLAQLDKDAEMKRSHLALFLSCKESIRLEKVREARHKRIGYSVRWILGLLMQLLRWLAGSGRDIVIEMLPEPSSPARPAPRALSAADAPGTSSPGARSPPRRSRKVRPDAPAPAEAGAEKADPASS